MTDPTPTRAEVDYVLNSLAHRAPIQGTWTLQCEAAEVICALRERAEAAEALVRDHEEAAADKRRLTRVLDIELNGEAGAAPQASLCDLIGCATTLRERAEASEQRVTELAQALAALMETSKAAVAEAYAQEGQP